MKKTYSRAILGFAKLLGTRPGPDFNSLEMRVIEQQDTTESECEVELFVGQAPTIYIQKPVSSSLSLLAHHN